MNCIDYSLDKLVKKAWDSFEKISIVNVISAESNNTRPSMVHQEIQDGWSPFIQSETIVYALQDIYKIKWNLVDWVFSHSITLNYSYDMNLEPPRPLKAWKAYIIFDDQYFTQYWGWCFLSSIEYNALSQETIDLFLELKKKDFRKKNILIAVSTMLLILGWFFVNYYRVEKWD